MVRSCCDGRDGVPDVILQSGGPSYSPVSVAIDPTTWQLFVADLDNQPCLSI